MHALIARLLLIALIVAQSALLGAAQADARQVICGASMVEHVTPGCAHCPPPGRPTNSCCPDCPFLLVSMLPVESDSPLHINRPQIAVFPSVALRADRRAERPPVPPPRRANNLAMGSTPVDHHPI
jgi:hypothetical protein